MSIKKLLLLCVVLAVGGALYFSPLVRSSTNCGGNSAALAQVRAIATIARLGAMEAPDHSFRFAAANRETSEELAYYSRSLGWLPNARFLVSTAPITERESDHRRIIAVCDTSYRTPRWFGLAEPTHAASFADGSVRLISTSEFAGLDRSVLTPLDELHPPKSR
jgi:hypothetical protein